MWQDAFVNIAMESIFCGYDARIRGASNGDRSRWWWSELCEEIGSGEQRSAGGVSGEDRHLRAFPGRSERDQPSDPVPAVEMIDRPGHDDSTQRVRDHIDSLLPSECGQAIGRLIAPGWHRGTVNAVPQDVADDLPRVVKRMEDVLSTILEQFCFRENSQV